MALFLIILVMLDSFEEVEGLAVAHANFLIKAIELISSCTH